MSLESQSGALNITLDMQNSSPENKSTETEMKITFQSEQSNQNEVPNEKGQELEITVPNEKGQELRSQCRMKKDKS